MLFLTHGEADNTRALARPGEADVPLAPSGQRLKASPIASKGIRERRRKNRKSALSSTLAAATCHRASHLWPLDPDATGPRDLVGGRCAGGQEGLVSAGAKRGRPRQNQWEKGQVVMVMVSLDPQPCWQLSAQHPRRANRHFEKTRLRHQIHQGPRSQVQGQARCSN